MFAFRIATVLVFAALAFAHPSLLIRGSCSSGTVHCCDSVAPSSSSDAGHFRGLVPSNLQGSEVPLGFNCIPLNAGGAGTSGTCSSEVACCDSVDNSGDVPTGVNCSPIDFSG